MSLKELNFEIMDINELTENLLFNQKEITRMRKEIDKLEKLEFNELVKEVKGDSNITITSNEKTEKEKIEDDELDYYYEDLKGIKKSDTLHEDIKDVLPSKKHIRYNDLLTKLKLTLLKEIKEIERFIGEENIEELDLLKEFSNEIKLNREKIKLINKISKEKENEQDVSNEVENNLIFTTTSSGNVRALDEIKNIDESFYERFNGLFESIKDGTFKNVKRLTGNSKLTKYREVKDDQVRVVFDRLAPHDYAIIAVFTKKNDNDRGYQISLINKVSKYKVQKDSMIKNLGNEEYKKLNKQYEQELFNKLGRNNIKSKQKVKGVENNE